VESGRRIASALRFCGGVDRGPAYCATFQAWLRLRGGRRDRKHRIERSAAAGRCEGAGAYEALDWLLSQQTRIENGLARRHLRAGVLVLYDVSSSYFEGRCCPLAQHGYSRDHRSDRSQIVYGLLCTRSGLLVAVEVFEGNAADPSTLSAQVSKLKRRSASAAWCWLVTAG
jgi:hypothetical protein